MDNATIVLVFGTFDGLHDGHRFFLREAQRYGEKLVVSVATDEVVLELKKRAPKQGLAERMAALMQSKLVDEAVAGDTVRGNWSVIKNHRPAVVAVGHDQNTLEEKLREFIQRENLPIAIVKINALEPDRLHSRFLLKK